VADKAVTNDEGLPGEPRSIFVISPIGAAGTEAHRQAKLVLDYLVRKAFPSPQWTVIRADDENSPDSITTQVIDRIVTSDVIVADLSDHNPNVFYELAVAHGYQRPVIHLMRDGQSMPFDVIDQRVIFYDLTDPASVESAKESLIASEEWLRQNKQARSPLSAHGSFTALSNSAGETGNEAIALALDEIVSRLARLERLSSPSRATYELAASTYGTKLMQSLTRTGEQVIALERLDHDIAMKTNEIDMLRRESKTPENRKRIAAADRELSSLTKKRLGIEHGIVDPTPA
jgi:hypothetical protein